MIGIQGYGKITFDQYIDHLDDTYGRVYEGGTECLWHEGVLEGNVIRV